MRYFEQITRTYENNVEIVYEKFGVGIYINSILSKFKRQGNATESIKEFINDMQEFDIYIFASDELDTDIEILNKWYEKLGFKKCKNNIKGIPYNCTHILKR